MTLCLNPACQQPHNAERNNFCESCGWRLRLGDRYQAVQLLSQGTHSQTWIGCDRQAIRQPQCVIKRFTAGGETPKQITEAFKALRQEAALCDRISQHPQIPDLLACFERDRYQFVIQTFVPGITLAQWVAQRSVVEASELLELLQNLLLLLHFLHSHQLIHRDIKPKNLIKQPNQTTWTLVDLGAIKQATATQLAQPGTVIGSAEYAAPEQLRGQATFASDLYSLGVTCLHLITGLSPFELFDSQAGLWHWRSVTTDIRPPLAAILDKLVQPNVGDRYASAAEVLQDLAQLIPESAAVTQHRVGRSPGAIAPSLGSRPHSWQPRHTWTREQLGMGLTALALSTTSTNPDSATPEQLVLGGEIGELQVWSWPNPTPQNPIPLQGQTQPPVSVTQVAISPEGLWIASGSWQGHITLWRQTTTGLTQHATWVAHQGDITGLVFIADLSPPSPSSPLSPSTSFRLISSGRDGAVKQWSLTGQLQHCFRSEGRESVGAIAVHPGKSWLASGDHAGNVQLWHLGSREGLRTLPPHQGQVSALGFSPEGRHLLSAAWDNRLWNRNPATGGIISDPNLLVGGHTLPITCLAVSPDGQWLATGGHESHICLWQLPSLTLMTQLRGHSAPIHSLAIASDGQQIFSGSAAELILWQC